MIKVFVSGCYDIIHGGHIRFFEEAKSFGDHLTVCVATDEVLGLCKKKNSSIPLEHKVSVLKAIRYIDSVVVSSNADPVLDFKDIFLELKPDILVIIDDENREIKEAFCKENDVKCICVDKNLSFERISTSDIIRRMTTPFSVPFRVDLAGGWLDVPSLHIKGSYIVNCTIDIFCSLKECSLKKGGGVGLSAAESMLKGECSFSSEMNKGVGWQDPAVIKETGLCVWRSGDLPSLELKTDPSFLKNMALYWTGNDHLSSEIRLKKRDYDSISFAGKLCRDGVWERNFDKMMEAVHLSYLCQKKEGMNNLPDKGEIVKKYCGSGWGGYAIYFFKDKNDIPQDMIPINGYINKVF